MAGRSWLVAGLVLAVLGSALAVIYMRHESRQLFVELSALQEAGHELDVEWARLQIEEGTLTADGRIERIARERLDMVPVSEESRVVVRIDGE